MSENQNKTCSVSDKRELGKNAGVQGHRVGVRPGPTVRCLAVLPDLADIAWTSLARRRDFWANKLTLARDG